MIRRIAAALAAAFLLAACTSTAEDDGDPAPTTAQDLEEISQEAIEALAAGDSAPLYALFSTVLAAQLSEPDLTAAWQQTIAPAGEYIGTAEVSARGDAPVVMVTSEFSEMTVLAELTFGASGQLEGLWFSYGEAVTTEHPDPPALPEGATEDEIAVGQYELPGKLVLPSGAGTNVVVLLIAGSGPNDMDGTVGSAGNAILRDLAYQLAEQGVPTLRYDKRFHARPDLATSASTIQDEVLDDAAAAVALLAELPEVADRAIVVLGHSLGGMVLPAIAAAAPEVAAGVIVAGTARSLWAVLADQNEQAIVAALEAGSLTEDEAEAQRETLAAEIARAEGLSDPGAPAILGTLPAAYVVSMNELRLPDLATRLEIPLLVLQGENDFQVSAEVDFESWRPVLGGNPDVTYRLFPGLNHLMMPVDALVADISQYNVPNAVTPEVSVEIAAWLAERWA